jgi:hypothetical protein
MALARLNDFVAGTIIQSSQVDAEFDQLVESLNGVDPIEILHKFDHATTPVLNLNQLNTSVGALALRAQQNSVDTFKIKANGYIVGYPKCILQNNAQIGNVGAGLDPLRSLVVPTNTMASDGDFIIVIGGGSYANTEANKQLRLTIDGQLIISFGATIDMENGSWYAYHTLARASSTTLRSVGHDVHSNLRFADGAFVAGGPSGYFHTPRTLLHTVSNMNSNPLTVQFDGEGSADNDVVQNFMQVWACQMS